MTDVALSLSVVIPLFNGAKHLLQAVDSIQNQTFTPRKLEIIMIDDGSTDDTKEVSQMVVDSVSCARLVQLPSNRGVAYARNLGVKESQYDYVAFCDQDDLWDNEKLRTQFLAITSSAAPCYVIGQQSFFKDGIRKLPAWFRPEWMAMPQKGFVFGALLIKRNDFIRVGWLNESYRFGGDDVDWFARARASGLSELILDEIVLFRRVHDTNASSRTLASNKELIQLIHAKIKAEQ